MTRLAFIEGAKMNRTNLNKWRFAPLTISLAGLLMGCESSGLSSHGESASTLPQLMLYAAPDIQAQPTPDQPKGPVKVALGQVGEIAPPQAMMDALRSRPDLFARVEPISVAIVPTRMANDYYYDRVNGTPVAHRIPQETASDQMERLRATAAGLGMDYLLIFGGNVDHGHQATGLSILDLTIVGAFVIPSNGVAVSGRAAGTLINAHTGQIAFNCSSETEAHGVSPSAFADTVEQVSMKNARDQLVQKLALDAMRQMQLAL